MALVAKQLVGGMPDVERRLAWAVENFRFQAAQAVGRLRSGEATLSEFQTWGRQNIKDHLYMIAEIGAQRRLTRKEIYQIRRVLKEQVKYWGRFAQAIAEQRHALEGLEGAELDEAEDKLYAKFGRRAQSYSGAIEAEGTKWAMAAQFPEGQWFRWKKTPVESCETCIERDGGVWQMKDGLLPFYPRDGSTICLFNCKCYWQPMAKPPSGRRKLGPMGARRRGKKLREKVE
jgi:hypothetical protein